MSVIVYIPTGLQTPELEIMLSKAQSAIDAGESTVLATCAGGIGYACSLNIYGLRSICVACKSQTRHGLGALRGSYEHIETPVQVELPIGAVTRLEVLENRWTLKDYIFEGVDVGQAAYSSYIGVSRDQDLEGRLARCSLSKLLVTSENLVSWARMSLSQRTAHRVVLYNGRQNQYRPLLRVAQQMKIPVEVMEFSGQNSGCVYTFEDQLPQDLDVLNRSIEMRWKTFGGDIRKCAADYYSYKRSGGVINDSKAYVLDQKAGMLPVGWDASKHNVAIFNSSEDEFAALGGEYDKTLYRNQTEAITRLCESLHDDPDVVLWLRIHPNLKDVGWSFAARLHELQAKHANVHVIAGDSSVSSYSLLDACAITLSFGSTMGVEAAYWGKPSILVGRCVYERLGSVYTPTTHEEVVELIRKRDLSALPVEGAYKVALFWSLGGHSLHGFSGNRATGFKFAGRRLGKTAWENLSYGLGKFIEKAILGRLINFGLRRARSNYERGDGALSGR